MADDLPPDNGAGSPFNTEAYDTIVENPFLRASDAPFSTFSIDVDTASYANVRRMLNEGQIPPAGAVRIEEMINYFTYDYPQPTGEHPFSVNAEIGACPWSSRHRLVRIGLKGKEIDRKQRKPSNLVFLIDVSGSMQPENKLPLVVKSMKLLTQQLDERDSVTIVVYAGSSGCVLEPTSGDNKKRIIDALDRLGAGGSTHGSEGIRLAYQMAVDRFIPGGVNRVILCTDGDFNVGITNRSELTSLIEEKAKSGVFLSILGFGMGNYKDATLEELTNKGNGNYAYIDTLNEAKKVLVEQMSGTLITIAKDVKIQIEFNPVKVNAYRLIGYENRMLRKEDFDDDKKDAGEIGAGHTVTAIYEIVPAGVEIDLPKETDSRYQRTNKELTPEANGNEVMLVKLRYKHPEGDVSTLLKSAVEDRGGALKTASLDFQFAAAVAEFALLLRSSKHKDRASFEDIISIARVAKGADPHGYRAEFIELVKQAESLFARRR
ncbi:MAG: hypothetical protein A2Z34_07230 [Planctomycetes bacterium RBG_16_59_8]|nr:MAG: hypothetical protein A2Z34_07230 [Planctomycetes bacterium RBG_16_59_8]